MLTIKSILMYKHSKPAVLFLVFLSFFYKHSVGQTDLNGVRNWIPLKPAIAESDIISGTLTVQDITQSTKYLDAFGRIVQQVVKTTSPSQRDVVSVNAYDPATGLELKNYLPFVSSTGDGNYKSDGFTQQTSFNQGQFPGENNFYSKIDYENSPFNRVLNMYAPGASWGGAGKGITTQYLINTIDDNVQMWSIDQPQGSIPYSKGAYAAGTLYKTITTNEQGVQSILFKDNLGQTILRKSQLTATVDNGTDYTGWLWTYYVYDDAGNLRFVIPPKANELISSNWKINQNIADELCFRYEYDLKNRMIIKKIPGTQSGNLGEVWMVYDVRNRLVMMQDGNMRNQLRKWQYFQYDNLDRLIATGLMSDPSHYNDLNYYLNSTSLPFPNLSGVSTELLSQTFYNDYSWAASAGLSSAIDQSNTGNTSYFLSASNTSYPYPQSISQTAMTRGLLTGTKTEVLGSNGTKYLYTAVP